MNFRVRSHVRQGTAPGTGFAGAQGWRRTVSDGEEYTYTAAQGPLQGQERTGQRLLACTDSELQEYVLCVRRERDPRERERDGRERERERERDGGMGGECVGAFVESAECVGTGV